MAVKIFAVIDGLDVVQRWPAGVHVDWQTGIPDGRPEKMEGKHTHCSAFAAAAAQRLGVYLLRPPAHSQVLLANAQYDWLQGEGASQGWTPVQTMAEAQDDANRGQLVVAVYHNRDDDRPGHIAIIRPGEKSTAQLASEGPDVTQAGGTNYQSTSLKQGFAGHPRAWREKSFLLFAHPVDPNALK
ncbi:hypothetical protein [Aestuariivirga sp.]|uniref:hypothetical protein n=1 Tax=Aestuariivirga sp. TaxID=2650926 RepID=UPI0039E666AE